MSQYFLFWYCVPGNCVPILFYLALRARRMCPFIVYLVFVYCVPSLSFGGGGGNVLWPLHDIAVEAFCSEPFMILVGLQALWTLCRLIFCYIHHDT